MSRPQTTLDTAGIVAIRCVSTASPRIHLAQHLIVTQPVFEVLSVIPSDEAGDPSQLVLVWILVLMLLVLKLMLFLRR